MEAAYRARRTRQLLVAVLLAAITAALPFVVSDAWTLNLLVLTLLYAAVSQAWNILGGYCGQISLGHALFFGAGAYTTTILWTRAGVSPWFGMAAGAALAAAMGLLVGAPTFRLRGHYFTIATIVVAEAALLLVHNWDWAGAAMGIQWPFGPDDLATLQFARDKRPYVYVALGILAMAWTSTWLIEGGRWGYWWRAVKDSPEAAESLGVQVFRSKLAAAAISAALTGLGGGFYAAFVGYIDPDSVMAFRFSLLFALPAVLGGIGTLWGPVVGAAVLIPLSEATRSYLGGSGSGIDLILYGGLIVVVSLLRPAGLVSLFERRRDRPA